MDHRIRKLNELQDTVARLLFEEQKATAEMTVGFGKTITAIKACYLVKELAEKTYEKKYRPTVLFLAETSVREKTLKDEAKDFEKYFGKNFYKDFRVKFACYQGVPKSKPIDICVADEIHDGLTPAYSQVFAINTFKYIFGLSAYIPETPFNRDDEEGATKRDVIKNIAPIVYTYGLEDAIKEGILSPFRTTILKHKLDNTKAIIKDKVGKKTVKVTERDYYLRRKEKISQLKKDNEFVLAMNNENASKIINSNNFMIRKLALENTRLLWNLPSKADKVKKFMKSKTDGKSIVFTTGLDLAYSICKQTVSSRRSALVNDSYINKFNKGKINTIGSFKMLKQGITLKGVQNCMLVSYFSQIKDVLQMIGRVVRFVDGKVADVYIVVTEDTLEEKWLNDICKEMNMNIINTYEL